MFAKFWLNRWSNKRWGAINGEVCDNRANQPKIRIEAAHHSVSNILRPAMLRIKTTAITWNFHIETSVSRYLWAEISEKIFASASPFKWQNSCRISAWAFIEYIIRWVLISHKLNSECNKFAIISKLIMYHFINCVQRDRLKVPTSFASSENFPNGFFRWRRLTVCFRYRICQFPNKFASRKNAGTMQERWKTEHVRILRLNDKPFWVDWGRFERWVNVFLFPRENLCSFSERGKLFEAKVDIRCCTFC